MTIAEQILSQNKSWAARIRAIHNLQEFDYQPFGREYIHLFADGSAIHIRMHMNKGDTEWTALAADPDTRPRCSVCKGRGYISTPVEGTCASELENCKPCDGKGRFES